MNIKIWAGKYGMTARFYRVGDMFFIDYDGGKKTSGVGAGKHQTMRGYGVSVAYQRDDVPTTYKKFIKSWFEKACREGLL